MTWPSLQYAVTSGGHAGYPYHVRVYLSPEAMQAYQTLTSGSALPQGSKIVQLHLDREPAAPAYAMEKVSASEWSFSVLDSQGHVVRTGNLNDCARCHAEAVADHLFGQLRN